MNKLYVKIYNIGGLNNVLYRLHITENQNAYSENYRSPNRLGKSAKRHFTDPSLACACLDLTKDKLLNDPKTFGFMFESYDKKTKVYVYYSWFHRCDSQRPRNRYLYCSDNCTKALIL